MRTLQRHPLKADLFLEQAALFFKMLHQGVRNFFGGFVLEQVGCDKGLVGVRLETNLFFRNLRNGIESRFLVEGILVQRENRIQPLCGADD